MCQGGSLIPELESTIESRLIQQLTESDSQWVYRPDLNNEEKLWENFRHILEQNNKPSLKDHPLTDSEFEQVKNQLSFPAFYDAGRWIAGENGIAHVDVQRDTETVHLMVINRAHKAGGTSVYEVIHQYQALKDDDSDANNRDRRFDISLLINGLPLIHIELKNREHSYMEGFYQIKKYIREGKFSGIFSAVQMFITSNAVNTKYFAAAEDDELNEKFMSSWLDEENRPVANYLDFAANVLKIPEAHEMVTQYTVLDNDAKRLIILRPYQVHAIEAVKKASYKGESGFVWHTTGSGKTMTSYKTTRNLLVDIPSIEKAVFLIDRKDLDAQTTQAFQSYADYDVVDVDETDNVEDLISKLKNNEQQMIVTTIQKLQIVVGRRLARNVESAAFKRIKGLRLAFVVDECHRAVSPKTKRELQRFFTNSLWYGYTGTPRFEENAYPEMGDLPRTTEELYGKCLSKYTVKEAIHDEAVLGFQVEYLGETGLDSDDANENIAAYDTEPHMLQVLDVIINKTCNKFGIQNGCGRTYDAILTAHSIPMAQNYYSLLKQIKQGKTSVKISEEMTRVLPDFPKFAITYSLTENEDGSIVNQEKMQTSLDDYNAMFGTHFGIDQIPAYNKDLSKRLARKEERYRSREQQLDLVIVVDRLLTGFDAPCLSTLFIDRQPMSAHDLIQAFSRTNRKFDKNKTAGQIVTFQSPHRFRTAVDQAMTLYSAGGQASALAPEWEEIREQFIAALSDLRLTAETPAAVPGLSQKEQKRFARAFQVFDKLFAQLKSFTRYDPSTLPEYGITEEE